MLRSAFDDCSLSVADQLYVDHLIYISACVLDISFLFLCGFIYVNLYILLYLFFFIIIRKWCFLLVGVV